MAAEGMYPAIDPIASSSVLLDPLVVGEEHADGRDRGAARRSSIIASLQDVIALLGIEELGAEDRLIVERARRLQRFLTQPFAVTEAFTGERRPLRRSWPTRSPAARRSSTASATTGAESSLYMVGALDEARAKEGEPRRAANGVIPPARR